MFRTTNCSPSGSLYKQLYGILSCIYISSLVTGSFCQQLDCLYRFVHSFIPSACAECDDSLPFSQASSIPLCYVLFPATLLHQLFSHPPSLHLVVYFLVSLSTLLFPNSYIILILDILFSSIPLCYVLFPATLLHNYSPILPHLILPSISWSPSQPCCIKIHI